MIWSKEEIKLILSAKKLKTKKNYCGIILSARKSHLVIQMCKETQLEQMHMKFDQ